MCKLTPASRARIEKTQEGYMYAKVSNVDCFRWGGMSVCDTCNEIFNEGYLVFALGRCICPKCFEEFASRHTVYEEDLALQEANYEGWFSYYLDR